jgi:hypothetical protein
MKPSKKTKFHDLWCGLRRHPWRILTYSFAAFSVLWTLTGGITHFLPGVKIEGGYALTIMVLASFAYGLNRFWKPSKIVIKVATTNTKIEVLFGDLFVQNGLRGIGVTEFFESELGAPVSETSLHGQFLKRCFGGGAKDFDEQLNEELKGISAAEVEKADGKKKKFPIGTTAQINVDGEKYIVFALAETDPETCKANSDVTKMWIALHSLWQRARIEAGGYPLNLPLIGSGLSGIGLQSRDLLNLIILSAITETKANRITEVVRIVLHPDRFEDIDLRDVKKYWEE